MAEANFDGSFETKPPPIWVGYLAKVSMKGYYTLEDLEKIKNLAVQVKITKNVKNNIQPVRYGGITYNFQAPPDITFEIEGYFPESEVDNLVKIGCCIASSWTTGN